jgi:glycosyltransferase involved in cell wall biosynthesis
MNPDADHAGKAGGGPLRVAIFATHPIQYQAPLWRQLAGRTDLAVHVFFGTDMSVRGYRDEGFGTTLKWDLPLLQGYPHTFLSTDPSIQSVSFAGPRAVGVRPHLRAFRPEVALLTGYNALFHLDAWRAARVQGARVVLRHEATDVAFARSGLKAGLRDALLRFLYGRVDRFAAIGTEARRHLQRLGVPATRIGSSPYCVDTDFMETQVQQWRAQRTALRAGLGIAADDIAFVFSGKLIPRKDPLLLLAAMKLLPADVRGRVHLVVAGNGQLSGEFTAGARAVSGVQVHQLGFLNQTEIGRAYAAADALVLPSRRGGGETWGLVVNEAMQFGLPAIVSDGVGCHPDLVREGETGFVFTSGSAAELAEKMTQYVTLAPSDRAQLALAAQQRVASFSLNAAAGGLADVIQEAAARTAA